MLAEQNEVHFNIFLKEKKNQMAPIYQNEITYQDIFGTLSSTPLSLFFPKIYLDFIIRI